MAHRVQASAIKPDDLSSNLEPHMVEVGSQLLQLSSDSHMCRWHVPPSPRVYTGMHTYMKKEQSTVTRIKPVTWNYLLKHRGAHYPNLWEGHWTKEAKRCRLKNTGYLQTQSFSDTAGMGRVAAGQAR